MKANTILETIGNTPVVQLNKLYGNRKNVWIKLEKNNPGNSIKDRIALAMIEDAERKGILNPDSVIVEPTSGNTGIGLALVAAVKGYKVILVMPESMSVERRKLMEIYGAKFELTPREKGMKGAIEKANELVSQIPNAWSPQQFDNPANVEVHERTTAQEIIADFPEGLDYIITGVGTGGHITGVAKVLKAKFPQLKVIAVEPELSPVLSGGAPGPHPLQGIGAGFIPSILQNELIDEVVQVAKEEAFGYARKIASEEGILVGISTGASLAAVAKKITQIPDGATILTFNYDTGERYLSIEGLFEYDTIENNTLASK
ncbi:cysteine synthase A [Flavobacterium humi]|uniref:Cysteine synthase n=1 Tax=Flavobacterium humi TaxID=2562683 RepID=A0A4Z0LAD9_9FLAO|nr:cysteine synthase A [Flavobacterium humi]TGD58912.1 cysteine synthase A [Flavobacterium humi]